MGNFKYVIFTDLDGTLLDKKTFHPGSALNTLQRCYQSDIPVIFVSAKTRVEIESIRSELDNFHPFVSENGGGLYIPDNLFDRPAGFSHVGQYWVRCASETIAELRRALKEIADDLSIDIRNFSDMHPVEIAAITGLDHIRAKLAGQREFDEPFQIVDETPEKIEAVIAQIVNRGYRHTEGGILHHITGNFNKGETLENLKHLYENDNPSVKFIGLGDAFNDIPMLKIVDHPFLVRKNDGSVEQVDGLDKLKVTSGIGPDGFVEAIEPFLGNS